jgi:ADP-ribosyl-[dinitrogen reductase] hydrolase
LGLAVGDALGTTLEFKTPGSFEPIDDMIGGGPFRLEPGQWTDDTSMALCLAESLTHCQGLDLVDQLERYVRWYRHGHNSSTGAHFDIGNATREALERFEKTGEAYAGSTHPRSAGNGSIMRLAPVPLAYAFDLSVAAEQSGESSRTTHGATAAVDACRYLGLLIATAARGAEREAVLSEELWQKGTLVPEIEEIALGSFKRKEPPEIQGSGYVVRSLEAALWALYTTDDFRTGALRAVNLGDDADTTGAVYGQLAGAIYGEDGIPTEWLEGLAMRDKLESLADELLLLSQDIT